MNSQSNEREVVNAGLWLAEQKEPPPRAVPVLKEKFGLSAVQACQAIKHAQQLRLLRTAGSLTLKL